MSKNNISFGVRLGCGLLYGASWLIGLLPLWFLYSVVAGSIYFLLYRVVRYRLKIVRQNLASSFPEKSRRELRTIERGFYKNLSEYFIDAIDLASITEKQWMRRTVWPTENRAKFVSETAGRNSVVLLAHYGSWEIMSAYGLWDDAPVMASVYRPLHNRVFDLYYKNIRNRMDKINSIPMNDLLRFYMSHRNGIDGRPLNIALIADQSPPLDTQSRWVPFLNHPTVFFHGGEKIARKFSLPVYFMHVRKVRRGHWEQTFELVWDGVSPTVDYAITGEYARLLEEEIRRAPELWLWSHRRWKREMPGDAAREYNEKYGTDFSA